MKTLVQVAVFMLFLVTGTVFCRAQEPPEFPKPQTEHKWLERFVGEWESEAECFMGPDKPAMKCKGTQQARMLGGFWMIAEGDAQPMGMQVCSVLTLGYDADKGKYVGTWIDSCQNHLWRYEGTVSEGGETLTLNTEGPSFSSPGETSKYREVIEFKNKDHYVFSSMAKGEDGKWLTFMTANFHRKK